MADGAQIGQKRVSSGAEVTRGATPSGLALLINPVTPGANWKADRGFVQSNVLSSDLEPGALISGNSSCSGTMPFELCAEPGFRQWEESAWSAAYAAVSLASVAGGWTSGTKIFLRTTGNFLTDPLATRLAVGDVTFGTGSTTNQTTLNGAMTDTTGLTLTLTSATPMVGCTYIKVENEIMKVVAISTTAVVITKRGACGTTAATHVDTSVVLPGRTITALTATQMTVSENVVTEAALTLSFTTTTKRLIPGTTRKILSVEQYYADKAIYRRYMGCEAVSAAYAVSTSGPITVNMPAIGTQYALTQSAGGPTYAALLGKKPFTPAGGSGGSITKDGAAFAGCVENLNFGVDTGRVIKNGVGEEFACFVEQAPFRTLNLSAGIYLVDNALQTLHHAGTRFAMQYIAVSPDGDKRRFNWPELVITDDSEGDSGSTLIENLSIGVEKDPTELVSWWSDEVLLS